MELSARKKLILKTVINDYIRTAEPVGSKALASRPELRFSSATIRNEMSELEEMGYLEKPHTSAGRIPSPAGYRLYVDELMGRTDLSVADVDRINSVMKLKVKELDRMGRNMEQIKREWQELQQMGVSIIVTDTPLLNTANKTDLEKQLITNIVFELLAYMAEKERQKIHARQSEGIAIAKQQGKYKGRKPIERVDFPQVYKAWKAGEITAVAAMERLQLSKTTFYRKVKEHERGLTE